MKRITMAFTAMLTVGLFATSFAQTVDEIVAKNTEAMGGAAKLATLKTVRSSGTMNAQGTDVNLVLTKTHNVGMRVDLEIMGTANYQVANAKGGYVFMPIMGMTDPKAMSPGQVAEAMSQTDLRGQIANYKTSGAKLTLEGTEQVAGKDAFKLVFTPATGSAKTIFIDKTTYRVVKQTSSVDVNGVQTEVSSEFGDYKQNADGYWFAYSVTNAQGTINFDKIESNVAVEDTIYNG